MERRIFVVLLLMAAIAGYASDGKSQGLRSDFSLLMNGPVCLPGDPCGPQPMTTEFRLGGFKLNGPVCLPGDPCGPGGRP